MPSPAWFREIMHKFRAFRPHHGNTVAGFGGVVNCYEEKDLTTDSRLKTGFHGGSFGNAETPRQSPSDFAQHPCRPQGMEHGKSAPQERFSKGQALAPPYLKRPSWDGGRDGKNIWNSSPERTEGSGGKVHKRFSRNFHRPMRGSYRIRRDKRFAREPTF
jgi:hypothetical protein